MGVRIATGADTDYGESSVTRISHEVMRFAALGMTPLEALVSATSGAAELIGVGNRTGRVAEGYEADLIVVEHDPLTHLETLQDVLIVLTNGRVAMNRLPFARGN
jgi:imidazolonepropionase-like amidohydrolase